MTGVINNDFVSLFNNKIKFGMIHYNTCSFVSKSVKKEHISHTKCCNCCISAKDPRLQNQLHIKIGIDVSNIPLIFNKQQ